MSKRILILYTSSGLGHKSIAENMGYYLQAAGHSIKLADAYALQPSRQLDSYNKLHMWVYNHAPFIWSWLYDFGYIPAMPLRVFTARFHYKNVKMLVDEFKPDLIISTQVSPSAIVSFLKRKGLYGGKFAISFSDFHLHRMWLYKEADYYLINIIEQLEEMLWLGVPKEKIFICGTSVKPRPPVDTEEVKKRFGIGSEDKVVLVAAGSLGIGMPEDLLDKLTSKEGLPVSFKLIIVCGKNEAVKKELSKKYGNRAIVLGYYTAMNELYAISNIFITKPGGLSIAESLQWRLPILITHFLPGQEKKNMKYLVGHRLVMNQSINQSGPMDLAEILSRVEKELTSGGFKKSLLENFNIQNIVKSDSGKNPVVEAVETMFHGKT